MRKRTFDLAAKVMTIFLIAIFFTASGHLPVIGDPESPPNTHVSNEYIENALEDSGSENMVTAVLADYRGFDTLFETTVMFTAGIIAYMLLPERKKRREDGDAGDIISFPDDEESDDQAD